MVALVSLFTALIELSEALKQHSKHNKSLPLRHRPLDQATAFPSSPELGLPSTLFYPRASGLPNGFSVKEARHARKTTAPQVPPWGSPPRRRRVCRQCSPFQPRPPKRRRGILGGRIGEHFPLQRLEISRSIVCFRITQLDLDGSHPHRSSVSLSLLKRSRCAAMVLSSGPVSPYEASFMSVLYVTAWLSFMARARKRPCASSGDHAIYEITPFSMLFLRRSQCSFYAIFIVGFTLGILSATHSEQSHQSALGYLRSHISANEISLVSPLLAAAF